MLKKSEIFQEKIKFILSRICENNLDKFVELFYIKNGKANFENRKYNLNKNWISKATISKTFTKEFKDYPFSMLIYNGKKLFNNAHDFLDMDLLIFQKKIEAYVELENKITAPNNLDYNYLYVFNRYGVNESESLDFYKLEHIGIKDNKIRIKVHAPTNRTLLDIKPYNGTLKQEGTKIILYFKNNHDYISAIFNTELSQNNMTNLTGVAIGIADVNQKLPLSKKVVLSKTLMEDKDELYLTLNESEIVSAKEDSYVIKHSDKNYQKSHLNKYIKKMNHLNQFFKQINTTKYFNSFYEQLAFKNYSSVNNIFQKVKNNHSYYINNRSILLEVLIKSYEVEKYNTINIVMPVYQKDNIFEYQSKYAIKLQEDLKELSKSITINAIFVLEDCTQAFSEEFDIFLSDFEKTANVRIAFKENVENKVNSIDFLYTDKSNFVVSKFLRLDNPVFYIFQDKQTVDEHEAIYKKIKNRSTAYKEFLEDKNKLCIQPNPTLKTISGDWYHYIYGSKQLWEDGITIFENGKVEYYCDAHPTEKGEIIHKEYQSVILLDHPLTKQLFTIVFDHYPYQIQNAFFTKNITKQSEKNLDIFSVGILSRKPIRIEKVIEVLGDIDDVRFLESNSMSEKLSDYLNDKKGTL